VEANAQAIQTLNELAVLLNQDVLSLQDRVTALEKGLADLQGANLEQFATKADLEELATKEDVAAVQEFAAALRSDLVSLSEKVSKLEGQVADLSRVQYSIKGSLSATYGTTTTTGADFDVDRLFPGNAFSTGAFGNASSPVQRADIVNDNLSSGSASLTFGVKVAQPGQQGVNIAEASATLGVRIYGTSFSAIPSIRLDAASIKGNVDGQAFSVAYSRRNSAFKFNDYLFANDNDPEAANPRQGVVATFSGTKFPLSPEVTLVAGVAGPDADKDGTPALNGNYFGIRTAFKPLSNLNLALNYATNLGLRSAIGVDARLELDPVSLSGLWVSSQLPGGPFANFFNNALSQWAYYVQGKTTLGPVSLTANYHAVDPAYADGQAGMSENEDTTYYDGLKAGAPYGANTRGLGISASIGFGPLTLKGYAESETRYAGGSGTYESPLGAALTLGSFRGFSLTGFYNVFYNNGNRYFDFTNRANAGGSYSYLNENQKYSSSFGVQVAHDGKAQDALIPTLNLTAQYVRFYLPGYTDIQVYANLTQPFKLAFLSLSPGFRYHSFTGAGPAPTYTTLKAGAQVSTDPLLFGLSLDGAVSYRNTRYTANPADVTTYELYYRAGVKISDFLAPKLNFSVAYAHYEGDRLAGAGLPTVGSGDQAFNFARDRVYRSPDPVRRPWEATPGTQSGLVEGFYLQADYYNLSVAYGAFVLNNLTRTSPNYGRGFRISYKVDF
jgi:polyhydroxyalkanoate synthesis regulator phasin